MINISKRAMLCCILAERKQGITDEDLEFFLERIKEAAIEYNVPNYKIIDCNFDEKLDKEFLFVNDKYYFSDQCSKKDYVIRKGQLEFEKAFTSDGISLYKTKEIMFTSVANFNSYYSDKIKNNNKVLIKK